MTLEARERDLVLSFLEVTGTARVPTPVNPDDAASKAYVDGLLAGLSFPTQPELKATTTTLVVEELDGSPRLPDVTRIIFDQADGFVLTNPSAKTARIDLVTTSVAATQAEMEAASSTAVAATPGRTQYHPGVAKAWGKWNDAGVLAANHNITSITDTGIGDHTVNVGTDFSTGNWTALAGGVSAHALAVLATMAAGTVQITGSDITTAAPAAAIDLSSWYFAGFGDQA